MSGEKIGPNRDAQLRPRPQDVRLILPWPPSMNQAYRVFNGRSILSKESRCYRLDVMAIVIAARCVGHFGRHRLKVEIRACQIDRRRRDLDNLAKATLDALTKAGLWEDDYLIDHLTIRRSIVCAGTGSRLEVLASVMDE